MTRAGGQAVVNGVLLRAGDRWAVAVRTPAGDIALDTGALPTWGNRWKKVPLVRGLVAMAEAAPLGVRAMRWSARQARTTSSSRVAAVLRLAGLVAALLLVPPVVIHRLPGGWVGVIAENLVAVAVVVGYAALVGRLGLLRTLFEYHGAEHKVVAAYEAGAPLTPTWAARFSTRHVRCGTSLLVVVAVLAILGLPLLLALPVAAELQLRAATNVHRRWVRALLAPGLALQRLTTREPSPAQLEVAIAALQAVIVSAAQPSRVDTEAVPA